MILITTAMILEARPIAERLGLSVHGNEAIQTFSNESFILVVTGTGPLRASAATGWALGRFPGIGTAVNIGFCGAAESVAPLYQWNYINSIRDRATGRLSVPDILWKHPFPEAGLLTSPQVVDSNVEDSRVVDMEGCGFFEAARQFLSPDQIILLKWVSDPLTGRIDIEETGRAYATSLDPVIAFLHDWPLSKGTEQQDEEAVWYGKITERIRLSEFQSLSLKRWLSGHLARGGRLSSVLDCLPEEPPKSKRENNLLFERVKDALKG